MYNAITDGQRLELKERLRGLSDSVADSEPSLRSITNTRSPCTGQKPRDGQQGNEASETKRNETRKRRREEGEAKGKEEERERERCGGV